MLSELFKHSMGARLHLYIHTQNRPNLQISLNYFALRFWGSWAMELPGNAVATGLMATKTHKTLRNY
tara:strand:- start:592 stop:792 length:201 start_codon:yes stop_codon:yes gene_type:complete